VTAAAEILAEEIRRWGPIPFSRFMEVALYHPQFGYYRTQRDPFGRHGDYYTAEQLQPVFGRLVRAGIDRLFASDPELPRTIVELGAGREDMRDAFQGLTYIPVDVDRGQMPDRFGGIVFANEFFDALPVDVVVRRGARALMQRIGFEGGSFVWVDAEELGVSGLDEGQITELGTVALDWIERIARALQRGIVFIIDYGYTAREMVRFPQGTLMSYRSHRALDDVLAEVGMRDITAHVNFSALEERAHSCGLKTLRFESLAATLLRAGEPDELASALAGTNEDERRRNKLQLKTLLFGMGETFRVLLLAKGGE
jgi:SAM-dependent MidA family methyltransferase